MADLKQLGRNARRRGKRVETQANIIVKKTALAIDAELVISTPVDEGRARSNWTLTLGMPTPPDEVFEPYTPGEGGSTGAANAQAAMDQARTALSDRRTGQEVHITNNLPYIGKLNDGWSAQAPAGFVERAISAGSGAAAGERLID